MAANSQQLNQMLQAAREAQAHAYSPYSKFKVGVCLFTDKQKMFAGCNVENISYSLTLCAESVALGKMIADGEKHITDVVLIGSQPEKLISPCGACRQRIMEFASPETKIHLCDTTSIKKTFKLTELLPESFSFKLQEK